MAGPDVPRRADKTDRTRFKDRVRQWREQAILEAVGELLVSDGCLGMTMDDVAKQVGIAKGSLYLHTTARGELVDQVLDTWAGDVPAPSGDVAKGQGWVALCEDLFAPVERGENIRPAMPCCMRLAPCPHGWMRRWSDAAKARGLSADDEEGQILGQAVQALASMESLHTMIEDDRIDDARQVVRRFIAGYMLASAQAKAV